MTAAAPGSRPDAPPAVPSPSVPADFADATAPGAAHGVLLRTGAALAFRNFRILWLGAFGSTVGTWMQKVAQAWLILTLTGSAFYLGLDAFVAELPILLFTLLGGVIADRHDRRRLLIGSQCMQMAAAFTLAALVYWDRVQVWHILALSFAAGSGQAFGGPAHQSLLPSLVPPRTLPNAIALNSIQFHLARSLGPFLAGLVLATWGMVACFGLNGLSFAAIILALLSLRVRHAPPAARQRLLAELRGGLSYVRRDGALVALIVLAFTTAFLSVPLLTLLPVFARQVFGADATGYSVMMGYSGAGSVAGALIVAWLGRFRRMGLTLLLVHAAFAALLVAFALTRVLWASHLLLFLAGAALTMVFATNMSLVQLIAPDALRGRVISIYMVAFRGGMPLGGLIAGIAATRAPAPAVLAGAGVLLALVSGYFLGRDRSLRAL